MEMFCPDTPSFCDHIWSRVELFSDLYRPQRSWAKVIFSQACVCPQGGLPQCMLGYTPRSRHPLGSRHPPEQTPLGSRHPPDQTPREQTPPRSRPPPGADTPPISRLQHTVNEQPVRILLECILVKHKMTLVQCVIGYATSLHLVMASDSKSNTLLSGLSCETETLGSLYSHALLILTESLKSKNQGVYELKFKDLLSSICQVSPERFVLHLESEVMRGPGSIPRGGITFFTGFFGFHIVKPLT